MPATPDAVSQALHRPEAADLARAAAALRHPALPPATIGEDGSLTPQAAAVVAVLQHPSLRALRSRRGVAVAQLLQAGILPNPQLSYSMDFPIAGATDGTFNAFGLGATWDVTSLIGREQTRIAASQESKAVDLEIAWQEWQTAMAAKLHATRVLWLSTQRTELERQVTETQEREQSASANVQAGLTTITDRESAGALVQRRRSALLSTEAALASEAALMRQALGLPSSAHVRVVADPAAQSVALPSSEDIESYIAHSRLDLAALRAGYESQEAKLHGAVLSQFPKIGIGITRARDTSNVGTVGFGVTLDVPIFDHGQGRIAVEHATRQQLFDELVARTYESRADADRALVELAAMEPQVEEAQRTAERLRSLARVLSEARTRGDADIVLLGQAENDAADAAVESIRLRQLEAELRIALEVATGALMGERKP